MLRSLERALLSAGYDYEQLGRASDVLLVADRLWLVPKSLACSPRDAKPMLLVARAAAGGCLSLLALPDREPLDVECFDRLVDVRLVVSFDQFAETYAVRWSEVANFLDEPTAPQLPLTWFRALGELVPEMRRFTRERRACFLDAVAHPESIAARRGVAVEAARAWREG